MSILFDNPPHAIGCGDPGDPIDFGCLFDAGGYLSRTCVAPEENTRFWMYAEVKRVGLTETYNYLYAAGTADNQFDVLFDADGRLWVYQAVANAGTSACRVMTKNVFRDPAAHYSIFIDVDTSLANATDRVKIVINGVRQAIDPASVFPVQNLTLWASLSGYTSWICSYYTNFYGRLYGRMYTSRFACGDAAGNVAADNFSYFNSYDQWVPKSFNSGDLPLGNNGGVLDFADPMDLGKDVSGNGNHFTATGLTVDNHVTDTPTNNKYVLNPLVRSTGTSTFGEGNKTVTLAASSSAQGQFGSARPFYFEAEVVTSNFPYLGATSDAASTPGYTPEPSGFGVNRDGNIFAAKSDTGKNTVALATGARYRVAIDPVRGLAWWGKAGDWYSADGGAVDVITEADIESGLRGFDFGGLEGDRWFPMVGASNSGTKFKMFLDPDDLLYAPPPGFEVPTAVTMSCPEILNPDEYFTHRVKAGGASVSDLPFNPTVHKALVVSKRIDADEPCVVTDTVNGAGFAWETSSAVNGIAARPQGLIAFTANGYSIGADTAYQGNRLDLIWRASPRAGFDIVTVDHTTGTPTTVPQLSGGVIEYGWVVRNNAGQTRRIYHHRLGPNWYFPMNAAGGYVTDTGWFGSTANTVTLGASLPTGVYTLYVWRSVAQFSSFGRYAPNNSNDGPVIPADFSPRLLQNTGGGPNGTRSIFVDDLVVNGGNDLRLAFEVAAAGVTSYEYCDFISNGVKARGVYTPINYNDTGFYYPAMWARTPGKFARAR